MPVDKFNRGLIPLSPQPKKIEYLRFDGKNYRCGDKIVDIGLSNKLVRVNNKYLSGLEVSFKPFINKKLLFIHKSKLIRYDGGVFTCVRKGRNWECELSNDKNNENLDPFKE